jgi:hypothetical protein
MAGSGGGGEGEEASLFLDLFRELEVDGRRKFFRGRGVYYHGVGVVYLE